MEETMEKDTTTPRKDNETTNPGSARFGNFINYYGFHPAENRIRLFPKYLSYVNCKENIVCLDVGCNTGELTRALHKDLMTRLGARRDAQKVVKCKILAVDLDETLIERAKSSDQNEHISFSCANVLSEDFNLVTKQFLEKNNKQVFDVVYCFSVTMWIHINHGDEGLKHFLLKLSKIADLLVIEPQPWKCYGQAVRRLKRSNSEPFAEFKNLKIRKDVESYIVNILAKECNFLKVLETAPTSWGRQILFYKRVSSLKSEVETQTIDKHAKETLGNSHSNPSQSSFS